ncbi:hypothetical protein [Bradyrhizobium sp. CCGUVB23]|uniref:hypothetical protein n=1 Tax=Bradyrhizobium sp. CCGUVB23 TaxID=2949630 RepID=UPI0035320F3F
MPDDALKIVMRAVSQRQRLDQALSMDCRGIGKRLSSSMARLWCSMGGNDLRELPLHYKSNLERFLARRPDGITVAPFESGEIGPDLFRAACRIGLEGLVSKHRDRPYQAGRSMYWVKVKNRTHPAMHRVMDALAQA